MPSTLSRNALALLIGAALASPTVTAGGFVADSKLLLDVRLRLETVDDDAFTRNAEALTLRSRIGWRSGSVGGLYAVIEAEDVRALRQHYNSTANGRSQYPVVVDPEGSEWNQAYLGWNSERGTQLALGRQRLAYDNHRFIGNVGWRQNEQTFDAVSLLQPLGERATLRYAWLDKANRVFGNAHPNPLQAEHDLDAHLLNLAFRLPIGQLSGYHYLIENQDLPATSTVSTGLRLSGSRPQGERIEWLYAAEFASQRGWRHAPSTGSVEYRLAEIGLRHRGHALRIGSETLGSNGQRAFQTPLATAHAFNGWADRFLATPAAGLHDRYIKIDGPLGKLRYLAAWHRFDADRGNARYGNELDLQLSWAFAANWNAIAKLADYRSDGFASDQRKTWLSVEYRY
jgi:hypothetical protein